MKKALSTQPQYAVFEKIVKSRSGDLMRVTVAVWNVAGIPHFRVLKAEKIEALQGEVAAKQCLRLYGAKEKVAHEIVSLWQPIASPFVSSIELFFTSQMTRAPAPAFS